MTNLQLRQLLQNQLTIMQALNVLLYARLRAPGIGMTAEEGQALMKLAHAQGATEATIEDVGR